MKIFKNLVLIFVISFLFLSSTPVSATYNEDEVITYESKESEINNIVVDENWEEIDYIIVLHDEGSTYIENARKNNIPIINVEKTHSMVSSRAFTHFKSVSWISREGNMSLSSIPKSFWTTPKEASWRELVLFFQYHPMYRNETNPTKFNSMYNQYICHINYKSVVVIYKGEYVINIEPWKADKGYWGFVSKGCN